MVSDRDYIFFDVDDTLIEWVTRWDDAFVEAARSVGVEVSPERALQALDHAIAIFYEECVREHHARGDPEAFWLDYDSRVLEMLGVGERSREAAARVADLLTRPEAMRLYPEVPQVLESLSAGGARLGIVTGRPRAAPDLERLGVLRYFAPVLDAFSVGSAKAAGRMFRVAAEVAAESERVGWHVGDTYDSDVLGARASGLRPVLVDRDGRHQKVDCPRVEDLRGLLDVIASCSEEGDR